MKVEPIETFCHLSFKEIAECLSIVLDLGTIEDELDEWRGWISSDEQIDKVRGKDDREAFIAWVEGLIEVWEAARARIVVERLMRWSGEVGLGTHATGTSDGTMERLRLELDVHEPEPPEEGP